jgi:hypothetical protein
VFVNHEHLVFLLAIDNALLDNDRIVADLRGQFEREIGVAGFERCWAIFETLRDRLHRLPQRLAELWRRR